MQLAKLTRYRDYRSTAKIICTVLSLIFIQNLSSQENSPYSRFGLGDMVPNTNIVNRGMGGISAAYVDVLSINYNNPASYSNFQTRVEGGKVMSGRVLLDVGINYDSRTLQAPDKPIRFSSSYGYFSHVHVGLPLSKKWGLSFGLRPVSRINYKIQGLNKLEDPITGDPIDSAVTEFNGNGGIFLPTIGTGYAFGNLSVGGSLGYLFGKKEVGTKRAFINDTVNFQSSNYINRITVGGVFFNVGAQYKISLKKGKDKETALRLGASGNWEQTLDATRDLMRETFITDINGSNQRVDSVNSSLGERGELVYPASYTMGFILEHSETNGTGWLFGVDYVTSQWNNYKLFSEVDAVQNSSHLRIGGQIRPRPSQNYLNNIAYRAGFFIGTDYIKVKEELPQYGFTFGLGLPIGNYSRLSPGQFTMFNLGFEYSKRGNENNLLKENLFRVSVGFNFSDLWFNKRRYD